MTVARENAPQRPGPELPGTQVHTDSAEAFLLAITGRRRAPTVREGAAP